VYNALTDVERTMVRRKINNALERHGLMYAMKVLRKEMSWRKGRDGEHKLMPLVSNPKQYTRIHPYDEQIRKAVQDQRFIG
jgi:hypothetical protein